MCKKGGKTSNGTRFRYGTNYEVPRRDANANLCLHPATAFSGPHGKSPRLRSPFHDEGARGLAVVVKERIPVCLVDRSWSSSGRDEGISLDPIMHGVARPDTFLVVARVQDTLGSGLLQSSTERGGIHGRRWGEG